MKRGAERALENPRPRKKLKSNFKRCGNWLVKKCAYTYDRLAFNAGLNHSLLERLSRSNESQRLSAILKLGIDRWDFKHALRTSIEAHSHHAFSVLLKYAHAQRKVSTVETFLVNPIDVRKAIQCNNFEALKQLYKFDPKLTQNDEENEGGLFLATEYDRPEMVKYLLHVGGDIEATWWGDPLLYFAINERREEIAKILIENGASVNANGNDRKPILSMAIDNDMLATVDLLLEKGAKPYFDDIQQNHQPFYRARKKPIIFERLLDAGLDPNQKLQLGALIHFVCEEGTAETLSILVKKGANIENNSYLSRTPLYFTLEDADSKDWLQKVEILVAAGANKEYAHLGKKPIHLAIETGSLEALSILLKPRQNQVPASLESLYKNQTAIHYAVAKNKPNRNRIIEFLAKNGSDITATFRDITLLEHALQQDGICCAKTIAKIFMANSCLEQEALVKLAKDEARRTEYSGILCEAAKTRIKFLFSCSYASSLRLGIKSVEINELKDHYLINSVFQGFKADLYKVESLLFGNNNFECRLPAEVVFSIIQNAIPDYCFDNKLFADILLSQYQKINISRQQNRQSSTHYTPMSDEKMKPLLKNVDGEPLYQPSKDFRTKSRHSYY